MSSKGLLANCVVDQKLFEQNPNGDKMTCSPECKKKWDSEQRRRRLFAGRMSQYRRLRELLGLDAEELTESSMLRKQLKQADNQLTINLRVSFGLFILAAIFFALWLAK